LRKTERIGSYTADDVLALMRACENQGTHWFLLAKRRKQRGLPCFELSVRKRTLGVYLDFRTAIIQIL
jgi:hypothetical protein